MSYLSERPQDSEYNPFYARYVRSVQGGDLPDILEQQRNDVDSLMSALKPGQEDYRYEPGKWSIREVLGHVIDTEWVFGYRLLRIARGDDTPLPGMDQDEFMAGANFSERAMEDLLREFNGIRTASTTLIASLPEQAFSLQGTASGFPVTVRAIAWIIAGQCQHHISIIEEHYL